MSLRRTETVLAICVVGLACFIGGQAVGMRRATRPQVSAGAIGERIPVEADIRPSDPDVVPLEGDAFRTAAPEMTIENGTPRPAPTMLSRDVRRRIDDGAAGTYIDDLIRARDSAVVRWPDRTTRPLRVWIAEDDQLAGWNSDFLPAVRDAFDTWVRTGIPVRFTFVIDSASADVHVRFTERFASGISGKTIWSRDSAWWLVSSDIQLALAHPGGGTVTPPQIRAIALHEVGHLLGLDHAEAAEHIMSARIRVRDLTDADRATVRLLYSIPAGSLR